MKHMLVLHADPSIHRKTREAFAGTEYQIHSARTVADLGPLRSHRFEVVLVSGSLPDGSGYDAAEELRERHPGVLILFVTNAFELFDQKRASACGGDGVLRTPTSAEDIRSLVGSLAGPIRRQASATVEFEEGGDGSMLSRNPAEEQLAVFLPRTGHEEDFLDASKISVEPVDPRVQAAVLQSLPEVLEGALRAALRSSPSFRRMVAEAVREAIDEEKTAHSSKDGP